MVNAFDLNGYVLMAVVAFLGVLVGYMVFVRFFLNG